MRGLTLLVLTVEPERARGVLTLALAHAAMGARVRLFWQFEAVALLQPDVAAPQDAPHRAAGLPPFAALVPAALDAGVTIIACQTGLDLCGMSLDTLDPRIEAGGLVSTLATLGDDRLLAV